MYITKSPDTRTKTGTFITVAEVKAQLRIEPDFTDDDTIIQHLIDTAIELVEDDTNSDFLDTANTVNITTINGRLEPTIRVYVAPIRTFTKIEIQTVTDGPFTTLSSSDHDIENGFHYFTIKLKKEVAAIAARLTFTSGYTATTYPKKLKQAVIIKAADLFDSERSDYAAGVTNNLVYNRLIEKHCRRNW